MQMTLGKQIKMLRTEKRIDASGIGGNTWKRRQYRPNVGT